MSESADSGNDSDNFNAPDNENSSDDMFTERELMGKENYGVDPLDTFDNAFFQDDFSRWCKFSSQFYFHDDPVIISPIIFAETKAVKMDVTYLSTGLADEIASCDRIYWIIWNCFHLEK